MAMLVESLTIGGLAAAGLGGAILAALLGMNLLRPRLAFWPASGGWRAATGLWLFRLYCAGLIAVALAAILEDGLSAWPRYIVGAPIIVGAFALSVASYRQLGRENTYFEAQGLVTDGFYALSRNPGYVASGVAALGLAVVAWTWATWLLGAALFGIYTLFALNEERWLLKGYGKAFRDYMRRTPRFVDQRSLDRLTEITGRA
jgi:protein-S-isoprenylcysteine O-methyltransferase Ste14